MKKLSARTWISIVTFVLIGAVLVFSRHELAHAWGLLVGIDLWILMLIVPAIILGYLATGEMIFSYLRQKKSISQVSPWQQIRISLELNFVNHILPSGGLSGVSYVNWRLKKFGVSLGKATMAQVVRYAMSFAAMAVILAISVIFVTADGMVNRWMILMSSGLVTAMVVIVMLMVMLMNRPDKLKRVSRKLASVVNYLVYWLTFKRIRSILKAAKVEEFLDEVRDDYTSLMREKKLLWQPFWWGMFFIVMEVAIFWVVFWALGTTVNPAPILIGYGIASATGFFIVTPGGAGAYEAVMVIVLGLAGMGQAEAIAGVVLARVITLLVTIVAGYVLYQQVVMRHGRQPNSEI